jgi:hypothetical protein
MPSKTPTGAQQPSDDTLASVNRDSSRRQWKADPRELVRCLEEGPERWVPVPIDVSEPPVR